MKLIFQINNVLWKNNGFAWEQVVVSARKGMEKGQKGVKITVELGPVAVTGWHSKSRYLRSRVCVRYPRQVLLPSGPRVNCDEWTPLRHHALFNNNNYAALLYLYRQVLLCTCNYSTTKLNNDNLAYKRLVCVWPTKNNTEFTQFCLFAYALGDPFPQGWHTESFL